VRVLIKFEDEFDRLPVEMPAVPRKGDHIWFEGASRKVKQVEWQVSTEITINYDGVIVTVKR
jgi:hypothetical protein